MTKESTRWQIFRDISVLMARSVFIRGAKIPVGLIIAHVLGPSGYALLQIINYIPRLTKYGSIGYDAVALREIAHIRAGHGKHEEEEIRAVAFTSDLLWSALLSLGVGLSSFAYDGIEVRWGLRIAAALLFLNQIARLYAVNIKLDMNFVFLAKVQTFSQLVGLGIAGGTVWFWGIFSVLGASAVTMLIVIVACHFCIGLQFRLRFSAKEWWRQTQIAGPMSLATLAYGALGWAERGIVGSLFGLEALGVYMLAVSTLTGSLVVVNTLLTAISVRLYERLGDENGQFALGNIITGPTLTLAFAFPILSAVIVFIGPPTIRTLLPAYVDVIPLFPWVAVMIWVRALPVLHLTAMNSRRLNQQVRLAVYWMIVVAVYSICTWGLWFVGLDLVGPMVAKLLAYVLLAILAFTTTRDALWANRALFWRDIGEYLLPFGWAVFVVFVTSQIGSESWAGSLQRMVLFIVLYSPMLWRWESRFGLLTGLGWLPGRWISGSMRP